MSISPETNPQGAVANRRHQKTFCEKHKNNAKFKVKKRKDGKKHYRRHKAEVAERIKEARKKDPNKFRAWRLRYYFGITLEQYNSMLEEQGGVCWICLRPQMKKFLAVDHDHKTNRIRGLLCGLCNQGLGSFGDSPELLHRAIKYLRRRKARREPKS